MPYAAKAASCTVLFVKTSAASSVPSAALWKSMLQRLPAARQGSLASPVVDRCQHTRIARAGSLGRGRTHLAVRADVAGGVRKAETIPEHINVIPKSRWPEVRTR